MKSLRLLSNNSLILHREVTALHFIKQTGYVNQFCEQYAEVG